MGTKRPGQCPGTTASGKPCRSPILGRDGYCSAHRPGEPDRMARIGAKGGQQLRKKWRGTAVNPDDLGPLESHDDAKRWLRIIGKAVISGHLTKGDAIAGIRAVEAWVKTEGEAITVRVVEDLKAEVARLKSELGGRGRLRSA